MHVEEITRVEALLLHVRTTRLWVWLPDELARRCRVERNSSERGQQLLAVLCGVAFFDIFLLSDADLIPDVASLSAWTRCWSSPPSGCCSSRWPTGR